MSNSNPSPDTRFTKGDVRINRKGRPRTFDALRDLAQQLAHELAMQAGEPITHKGADGKEHKVTVTEAILLQWATSKNPILQQKFIEIAFGKTPDVLTFGNEVILRVLREGVISQASPTPSSPNGDKELAGETQNDP